MRGNHWQWHQPPSGPACTLRATTQRHGLSCFVPLSQDMHIIVVHIEGGYLKKKKPHTQLAHGFTESPSLTFAAGCVVSPCGRPPSTCLPLWLQGRRSRSGWAGGSTFPPWWSLSSVRKQRQKHYPSMSQNSELQFRLCGKHSATNRTLKPLAILPGS